MRTLVGLLNKSFRDPGADPWDQASRTTPVFGNWVIFMHPFTTYPFVLLIVIQNSSVAGNCSNLLTRKLLYHTAIYVKQKAPLKKHLSSVR